MSTRRPPFVLWDFNGTLLDDAWLCVECLNALRRRRSMPEVSLGFYLEHFGFPVVDFYMKAGFTFEDEPFAAVAQEWVDLYHERLWTEVRLHEGAAGVLQTLHAGGCRQGILSAYHHTMLEKAARHFGIRDNLDPLLGLDDHHAAGKEELGVRWVRSCGVLPEDLILIGDTLHDRDVARAMGIRCGLVCRGHQARARLEASGVAVLEDIRSVPGFLASS
ncbi:MAG: HAD hydrolase-like protein [Elusimicrobia bacterium]|nr:HAD hydrolase-like protein [Elusimicrobiota bacterium]